MFSGKMVLVTNKISVLDWRKYNKTIIEYYGRHSIFRLIKCWLPFVCWGVTIKPLGDDFITLIRNISDLGSHSYPKDSATLCISGCTMSRPINHIVLHIVRLIITFEYILPAIRGIWWSILWSDSDWTLHCNFWLLCI